MYKDSITFMAPTIEERERAEKGSRRTWDMRLLDKSVRKYDGIYCIKNSILRRLAAQFEPPK